MGNSQSGFASLTPDARKSISAKGGRASARLRARGGRKGCFTAATAKEVGQRGGKATVRKHGTEHMRRIGGWERTPTGAAPADAPSSEPRGAAEGSPELSGAPAPSAPAGEP